MKSMTGEEWEDVAGFLLRHTVGFVDSELLETEQTMQEFELMIRILGEDRSVDGEGRDKISDTYINAQAELSDL